jgi:hypothetical protein
MVAYNVERIQTTDNDKKTRLPVTKSDHHRTRNTVNDAVKTLSRREIMMNMVFHP